MEDLNPQFKIKQDLSISMLAANLYVFVFALPIAGIIFILYSLLWDIGARMEIFRDILNIIILFTAIFIGIPLHEYIHGISWRILGRLTKDQIEFGFQADTLTPYAHSKIPLKAGVYRMGALMPFIILGAVPAVIALISGSLLLLFFSLVSILGAGGDLAIVWIIRKVKADNLVQDHPVRAGCYVLDETH